MAHRNEDETSSDKVELFLHEDLSIMSKMFGMSPIMLDYCGKEECLPGHSFGPATRTGFLLHMVTKGKGVLHQGEEVCEISAGQAFLIFPNEVTTYHADYDDPWSYMWIGFHGMGAEQMMAIAGLDREHVVLHCGNMGALKEAMEELLSVLNLTYLDGLRRMSLLLKIIALLTENNEHIRTQIKTTTREGQISIYVDRAVNLLMASSGDRVKVAEVAKSIGVSRNYLAAMFQQELGMSPQMFLMNYRMEKALNLLNHTTNPINLIAEEVGYGDAMSFTKAFRKRFGISPSKYRELGDTIEV
ncbi:MAG: helix-turn-helix domain-containing protein [Eubacteriales bacterium]|nr:helix-turn-helix domain-containing protein [Eubacteriales bacterium]